MSYAPNLDLGTTFNGPSTWQVDAIEIVGAGTQVSVTTNIVHLKGDEDPMTGEAAVLVYDLGRATPGVAVRSQPTLVLNSSSVTISWDGTTADFRPMKGFGDLAELLRQPAREVHVLELMGSALDEGSTGPEIDLAAKRAYEDKLRELQQDIHEAEDRNDAGRVEHLQDEFDQIVEALSDALGLAGRSREKGSSAEKARQAIAWRLRAAIRRIEQELPACGRHLQHSVRTGGFCSYDPEDDPGWVVR